MFTQCLTVLFDRAPTLATLKSALQVDGIEAPAAEPEQGWVLTGPSLTLEHRADVNGKVQIDVLDCPFPDAMGSPGTYEGTYLGMLDHNVTTIAGALGAPVPQGGLDGRLATTN